MLINVDYVAPERCGICKFIKKDSNIHNSMYKIFVCLLTEIGDETAEGYADQNRAEKRMKENCPFK